jgi:hypothetical protein
MRAEGQDIPHHQLTSDPLTILTESGLGRPDSVACTAR